MRANQTPSTRFGCIGGARSREDVQRLARRIVGQPVLLQYTAAAGQPFQPLLQRGTQRVALEMRGIDAIAQLIAIALDQRQFGSTERAFAVGHIAELWHAASALAMDRLIAASRTGSACASSMSSSRLTTPSRISRLNMRCAASGRRKERREIAVDFERHGAPCDTAQHQHHPTRQGPAARSFIAWDPAAR